MTMTIVFTHRNDGHGGLDVPAPAFATNHNLGDMLDIYNHHPLSDTAHIRAYFSRGDLLAVRSEFFNNVR